MFRRPRPKSIDVLQAQAALRTGRLVLIDVREESERAREHVPGSLHLPLRQVKQRLGELPPDRELAFICQSGRRSAIAATAARRAGRTAHNITGGMLAWERHGLDLERSAR